MRTAFPTQGVLCGVQTCKNGNSQVCPRRTSSIPEFSSGSVGSPCLPQIRMSSEQ